MSERIPNPRHRRDAIRIPPRYIEPFREALRFRPRRGSRPPGPSVRILRLGDWPVPDRMWTDLERIGAVVILPPTVTDRVWTVLMLRAGVRGVLRGREAIEGSPWNEPLDDAEFVARECRLYPDDDRYRAILRRFRPNSLVLKRENRLMAEREAGVVHRRPRPLLTSDRSSDGGRG